MIHTFALRRDCTCSVKHSLGHILNLQPSYSSEPHAEISYDCNAIDFDWTHMMRSWNRFLMPCYLNVLSQKKSVDLTSVDHFSIISVVVPTPLYILIAADCAVVSLTVGLLRCFDVDQKQHCSRRSVRYLISLALRLKTQWTRFQYSDISAWGSDE